MFRSYIKTALRFLLKSKTFSLINIVGLMLGTLCFLYIVLYVNDQYNYDRQHTDAKDIYRINEISTLKSRGLVFNAGTVVAPLAPAMKHDFGEVMEFTRVVPFMGVDKHLLSYNGKAFYEQDAFYVDSSFFDIFTYHFINGNASTALMAPYSVVLLQSTANRLFGKDDPIGKTITVQNVFGTEDYTVTGVVDESLGKSHLHANIFITMNSGGFGQNMLHTDDWMRNSFVASYVKLRPGVSTTSLEKKLPAFLDKYAGEKLKAAGIEGQLYLQSINAIHTSTDLKGYQPTQPISPLLLNMLLLIAVLIQMIACINFMNLSTARASKRAKEIGIRKIIGAERIDVLRQFLGESFLLAAVGIVLAFSLLLLALPYLNQVTHADIRLSFLKGIKIWLTLAGLIVVTGFVSGSYPAFYLSAFKAIKVMKGDLTNHISAINIRRGLVVFQFIISIVLITGIIIIYSQLNYIKNKDLGFDKDQRIVFSFYTGEDINRIPAFMADLRTLAGVKEVSNASKYLSNPVLYSNGFFLRNQKETDAKSADFIVTDEYFRKANGIKLVSGRDFSPSDSAKVLINETFAKQLGLDPLNASGTKIYDNQSRVEEIVGVMKDFNYSSLHKDVSGFLLWMRQPHDDTWPNVIVHTSNSDYKSLLAKMGSIWKKDIRNAPFSYSFLDEEVQKQYETEIYLSRLINLVTLMAIFISCLGLFGLAAFSAEQRSKEISIRKTLGASVPGIAQLLSKDFFLLVILAFAIAIPIAWWAMTRWLEAFAYRITISWWMFALAGIIAMFITLLTVSFQAIKAALVNPIKSLRSE